MHLLQTQIFSILCPYTVCWDLSSYSRTQMSRIYNVFGLTKMHCGWLVWSVKTVLLIFATLANLISFIHFFFVIKIKQPFIQLNVPCCNWAQRVRTALHFIVQTPKRKRTKLPHLPQYNFAMAFVLLNRADILDYSSPELILFYLPEMKSGENGDKRKNRSKSLNWRNGNQLWRREQEIKWIIINNCHMPL